MSRYQYTKIKKYIGKEPKIPNQLAGLNKSPQMRESTLYSATDRSNNDLYIISKSTDRLDLLADKYYSDMSLWWIIALANSMGKGSLFVTPGIQLRIPADIQSFKDKLNENQV